MIIYNKDKIKQLKNILNNDFYILTDFDGTITKGSNNSTWASILKMKKDSIVLINQITTISKQRIFKDVVRRNVKISSQSLDLIDDQIIKFFTK